VQLAPASLPTGTHC